MLPVLRAIRTLGLGPALRANRMKSISQQTIRGYYTTSAIMALLNVGFLDSMLSQGTLNLSSFAAEQNLDLRVLTSLCDYLFALRVLDRQGQTYSLTRDGKLIVEHMNGAFYAVYAYGDLFHNLEALLRQTMRYGHEVCRKPEFVAKGSGSIGRLLAFPVMIQTIQREGLKCIVDLGCGDAVFLTELCHADAEMRAYGIDLSPEAIAAGQDRVGQAGLQERIQLFTGDVLQIDRLADELHDIQAATSVYVLHEFLAEGNRRILQLFQQYRHTFPGRPLLMCEVIRHPPEALRSGRGGILEIQLFHELSNQGLLSREEWQDLFHQADFTNVTENYLDFARTAVYTLS